MGRDESCPADTRSTSIFQSTRPVWGATRRGIESVRGFGISIHAPRVGRDGRKAQAGSDEEISIHAPRVGRDTGLYLWKSVLRDFNPRAPCGARPSRELSRLLVCRFQSTRPVWGATFFAVILLPFPIISIHAPRVGRDGIPWQEYLLRKSFQSTRPVWGATISRFTTGYIFQFQSTRPVWGATCKQKTCNTLHGFQSTRPVWGATPRSFSVKIWLSISIHAPRVGRDIRAFILALSFLNFNPRAPCGARQ